GSVAPEMTTGEFESPVTATTTGEFESPATADGKKPSNSQRDMCKPEQEQRNIIDDLRGMSSVLLFLSIVLRDMSSLLKGRVVYSKVTSLLVLFTQSYNLQNEYVVVDSLLGLRRNEVVIEYLVNISKRRASRSLNEDILKITILKTNMPYLSRKIRRIHACTHQRPQRNKAQYAISREDQYAVLEI
ncbi:hypothetical protein Tco_1033882, partial [Tanacetum coccineum]